ncbi:Na+/H+-exchanging protein [Anaeromyxobacter diazotrophicus]|uniref:Na+/H+-exchanging protein n=1 Tax=Anaeromyxobacter diazotrophicus TaxID=2590199 RepID=A0A7I9VGR0_9BACT|nr:Na+/H+-exchanging protein [Anaeromyxobacter diazotrophicus]
MLVAAKLGGALAEALGQPAVLGELLAGIGLGALPLAGVRALEFIPGDATVAALAELGVILLLFEVGLSTRLADLLQVGVSALLVATVGVAVPMVLGWLAGRWLLPGAHPYVPLFLGATLCATSVGITARVLADLGRVATPEGRIILGAAVIDDVMGLLVLAVIIGMVGGGAGGAGGGALRQAALATGKAVAFLGGALVLGRWLAPRLFRMAARLRGRGVLLTAALVTCLALAWAAHLAGLAPIVGAFAAGLVLEGVPFRELLPGGDDLERLLLPLSAILVPIFFVRMGLLVNVGQLAGGELGLAAALTAAAIVGKQACALAVVTPGADRLAVGLGMIPRGEVGLIFAGMGLTLRVGGRPVMGPGEFAAVVAMVLATTLVTPPLLRWRLGRRIASGAGDARPADAGAASTALPSGRS